VIPRTQSVPLPRKREVVHLLDDEGVPPVVLH
jgi:hypothetical protein